MQTNFHTEAIFELFDAVQTAELFADQKTFCDAIPKFEVEIINQKFSTEKNLKNFDLKDFVNANFDFKNEDLLVEIVENLPIEKHIDQLWKVLTREAKDNKSSLLALPKPYIVPGGRFNEFFYWDSYFVMLGLQVSGEKEMAKNIVDNCDFLIQTIGFVPNGNRTYFLSRSQPPYFSLMVELLVEIYGDESLYEKYLPSLIKEYDFWMNGSDEFSESNAHKRVVKLNNENILNRYNDTDNSPRPESYLIDILDKKKTENPDFYNDVRSACESGWDFSSRWFSDPQDISTIQTQSILPIDLNCLLFHYEKTLENFFSKTDIEKSDYYKSKSEKRKSAVQKYLYDEKTGVFSDYNFKENKISKSISAAMAYPLFLNIATEDQAINTAKNIEKFLLKDGGIITTDIISGQQWDAPNAWAPLQWICFKGLKNYGFDDLADKIKNNWCENVERVYANTGKLMEKYNAMDTSQKAGGGEYPNQDGFGWTNGVYLKMKNS
ncbi:alpha,alpha-trehalase TreF [Halpernia frigidisoli]|uniref:Alpha,alpha-trehalase n=1 Tax=Halpernia frigidisoli TaxID=1125876 RepID=A0A1I3G216_9FLAO|nr:alpha,alpha-trehalase TreF [Halpernia frigidisoli]SFI17201.1 alpha,alpha-trehalase [Halpernia frigidisoli]